MTPKRTIQNFRGKNAFLSNFFYETIEVDGKSYRTVEHAYQAAKALNPDDAEKIRLATSPHNAKKLGRAVVIRSDWDNIRLDVMDDMLRRKFQIPEMRDRLLATGDAILEEGNYWHDHFWGVCYKCDYTGENHLGRILMKIREALQWKLVPNRHM